MGSINRIRPGQRAVVMGLGVSGRAAVRYLLASDVQVFVSDSREFTELPLSDQEYLLENDVAADDVTTVGHGPWIPESGLQELHSQGFPCAGQQVRGSSADRIAEPSTGIFVIQDH
ncbi:MAG: hypothetical protein KKA76_05495, partial [Proteobacteria bacterium]|nr:hypothetical protein [Pseudomonadota bacterium]